MSQSLSLDIPVHHNKTARFQDSPFFSIIIPVRNDAPTLKKNLVRLRAMRVSRPYEIVVVDGQSRDDSEKVAESLADKVVKAEHPGRGSQLHLGALVATGEILVFLHADTELPPTWQEALFSSWSGEPRPAATAFRLSFDTQGLYFKLISSLAYWRTRLITGVPHGDQAIALHRSAYFGCGGFPPVPLMEEYALVRRLKNAGPIKILPEKVITSSRRYRGNLPVMKNLRNLLIIALFYLGVSPRFLAKLYK